MAGTAGDAERDAVNFAFINARLITSPLHLQTAVIQALFAEHYQTMRTKTVHSEILWYLNPTHNINEAIRRYGISDATTDIVVVHIGEGQEADVLARMCAVVDGTRDRVSNTCTDWATVIEHYKLDDVEAARVDKLVTSAVAMKSVSV